MPITPTDILAVARHLFAQQTEPALRSAASRAYYAAYHGALWYADLHALDAHEYLHMATHERLSMRFERGGEKRIAIMLNNMKALRARADYHLDGVVDTVQVRMQCEIAQKLLDRLYRSAC